MEQKLWKNNLKQLRIQHGYTQRQATELLGLKSHNRLSRWEKGIATPSIFNLIKLAEIYRTDLKDLITFSENGS